MARANKSPLAWGRGLKPVSITERQVKEVAPRVGAWIETVCTYGRLGVRKVAPRVGAWIETQFDTAPTCKFTGRPSRGGVD